VVAGCSEAYRLEVVRPRAQDLRIERQGWERVRVDPLEHAWYRGRMRAQIRLDQPDWRWQGPDIPDSKPPFHDLFTDPQGRIWVVRQGPGRVLEEGLQEPEDPLDHFRRPRWEDSWILDVFAPDGRYLGAVGVPPEMQVEPLPRVDGEQLIALVEDPERGPLVRIYRLSLPE